MLFFCSLLYGSGSMELHPGALCQTAQRFREIPAIFLHHEFEDVAALIALAEAAPGAGIREDDKSGGACIAVEGTETGVAFSGFAQLYSLGD